MAIRAERDVVVKLCDETRTKDNKPRHHQTPEYVLRLDLRGHYFPLERAREQVTGAQAIAYFVARSAGLRAL